MNRLSKLFQTNPPPFKQLTPVYLPDTLFIEYYSKIYYTPKFQIIPYTQQFDRYIHYLRRKKYIQPSDLRQFTKTMLTQFYTVIQQDRPQLQIQMEQKVKIPQGSRCKYHGQVDFMFSNNGYNPTPVLHFDSIHINPAAAITAALSNLYIRMHLRQKHQDAKKYKKKEVSGFSIATTGHEWQMIKIDQKLRLQKSFILQGTKNEHRNIYDDEKIMQTILGMMQYTLDIPQEKVQVLEKAYQYLDQRKYMIEGDTQEEANKNSLFSSALQYFKNKGK